MWRAGLASPSMSCYHLLKFNGRSHLSDYCCTLPRSIRITPLSAVLNNLRPPANTRHVFFSPLFILLRDHGKSNASKTDHRGNQLYGDPVSYIP